MSNCRSSQSCEFPTQKNTKFDKWPDSNHPSHLIIWETWKQYGMVLFYSCSAGLFPDCVPCPDLPPFRNQSLRFEVHFVNRIWWMKGCLVKMYKRGRSWRDPDCCCHWDNSPDWKGIEGRLAVVKEKQRPRKISLVISFKTSSLVVGSLPFQTVVGAGSAIQGRCSKVNEVKGIPLFINQNQENLVSYTLFLPVKRLSQCDWISWGIF